MKKHLFIAAVLTGCCFSATSQPTESRKIDSLKRQVLYLKDAAKVDGLNYLAQTISSAKNLNWRQKADSVSYYASLAYSQSVKLRYKRGLAASLTNLANGEYMKGIDLRINKENDADALNRMEKYLSESIPLAEAIGDHETLGYAYMLWGNMLTAKSKFKDQDADAEYLTKSIYHFNKAGNEAKEGENATWLAENYFTRGFYEKAFEYCQRSVRLNKKVLLQAQTKEEKEYRNYLYQQALSDMADLYKMAGDYETALEYLKESNQFGHVNNTGWETDGGKAEIFRLSGNYDSAFFYLKKVMLKDQETPWLKIELGATFLLTNEYDSALAVLQESLVQLRKTSVNGRSLIPALLYIGSAYAGKRQYKAALPYVREGTDIALKLGTRPDVMKGYELLSRIHHHSGNNDSAYLYLLQSTTLKDSIQNRQFLWRLNNYKKATSDVRQEAQFGFLVRDNKIKEEQLKQESLFRKFLLTFLLGSLVIGFFIFRNLRLKRKNEKMRQRQLEQQLSMQQLENENEYARLQQRATELEMQALRAQMNPHFIFNCLSSINRFILKNETEAASDYLTRFSRLIRMVLIYSQRTLIPLEDELEILKLYLEMEQLRFKDAFDYSIVFTNRIDTGSVFIPPLLFQPFCENAIWHGLMHKDGKGHLEIALTVKDELLQCTITDDGVGRDKAAALKSKSAEKNKSVGLKITSERLALLNGEKGSNTCYTIDNVRDANGEVAGTRVSVQIRYKTSVEEFV